MKTPAVDFCLHVHMRTCTHILINMYVPNTIILSLVRHGGLHLCQKDPSFQHDIVRPCLKTKLSSNHSSSIVNTSYLEPMVSLPCLRGP